MRTQRVVVVLAGLAAAVLLPRSPALAACHFFQVSASPLNPAEGATVSVRVTRDAGVNPSSVRVRTVNGTATGGADFQSVDRRVEFTTETEQSFSLPVLDDTATEGTETFRIEVSEGAGCQVNPNFGYGAPVTVTIKASDAALASPAASAAPTKSVATQPNAVRTTAPAATVAPSGTATPAAAITSPPPTSIAPLDTASDTSTEPPIAPVGAGDDGGDGVLLARVLLSW